MINCVIGCKFFVILELLAQCNNVTQLNSHCICSNEYDANFIVYNTGGIDGTLIELDNINVTDGTSSLDLSGDETGDTTYILWDGNNVHLHCQKNENFDLCNAASRLDTR